MGSVVSSQRWAVNRRWSGVGLPTVLVLVGLSGAVAVAQDARQQLLERVFGDRVKFDPAIIVQVRALPAGQRLLLDSNGDGKKDEAWFIDTDVRHSVQLRPLLVRAIDEDGDLDRDGRPDLDSDLYIADWRADGRVDVALDYQDNDADNDVDETAFYFYMPDHPYFGRDVLRVWWGSDDGDDNLLWYDQDYTYYQDRCQYRCHFSGDESFVAFGLTAGSSHWTSAFENPFLFYDPDGDRCSEVVLRIEGVDDQIRAIRYSFDADDDASGRRTHDYDFSITAVAEKDKPVKLSGAVTASMNLRGIPTQGWLKREAAQPLVVRTSWHKACLTWDEVNANTEENVARDPHERWEGIIAHSSKDFPQIGGPPCSVLNKRNEIALRPASPMRLYRHPADHRLHLKGANQGWLEVDFDFDGKVDARYTWLDKNGDGIFDQRQLDLDADGTAEFLWPMPAEGVLEIEPGFRTIVDAYQPELDRVLGDSQTFIDAAKGLRSRTSAKADPAETFFLRELESWMSEAGLGASIRKSPGGARFYVDLVRDRLLLALRGDFGHDPRWADLEQAYAAGDYRKAAALISRLCPEPGEIARSAMPGAFRADLRFGPYAGRIPIRIDNTGGRPRLNWPVAIPVKHIKAVAKDFITACAVVAPDRWLDWREIPHQVDTIDPSVGDEMSFLVDVPGDTAVTYYVYYSGSGGPGRTFPRRTGTAEDWVPPNIGWENTRVAYRSYWGQFDFFGKKIDRLIYDHLGSKSYHGEVEWGIDALHVGEASGIGGLALYQGDRDFLVQNPAGKGTVRFVKRQLVQGPVRAAVEVVATNVLPEQPDLAVRLLSVIYAERQESEIQVSLSRPGAGVRLGPGLVKLPRERVFADRATGCMGAWGVQQEVIGEIGMAIIVPPGQVHDYLDLPAERRLCCRLVEDRKLTYWIWGDWRRGRQHPIAPTIDDWRAEVRELAMLLHHPPRIEIGELEEVP
ncbi:MAG TPA: DUF4861 family protein [Phycisphaerae bacterium]|nr:DUF4861 family protein [Phycisphaerae bacterium]HRY66602.1 DUF4861 family protein [Phycisphaerae bacterium]HSA27022.1 DUF4861 family protein [Phycisphaerae bacterium]